MTREAFTAAPFVLAQQDASKLDDELLAHRDAGEHHATEATVRD